METSSLKSPPKDDDEMNADETKEEKSTPTMNGKGSEYKDDEEEKEEQRRGRFLWLFVVNAAAVSMSFLMFAIYNNVVLRTLEKRFSLSSFQTGILSSTNDIMQISLVVLIGYFGDKGHKPRILSFTVMFAAVSGFMMASPHFVFNDSDDSSLLNYNHDSPNLHNNSRLLSENTSFWLNASQKPDKLSYCTADNITDDKCIQQDKNFHKVHPAYYIFIIAQFISGIGASALYTLSMTYIDENAPKNKLSLYLTFYMLAFSLTPTLAMLLSSFCLSLPENLLSGDKPNPNDPTFVGCWWLGYLICATFIIIFAIPLSFFPLTMRKKRDEKPTPSLGDQAKAFPRTMKKLATNKLYLINLAQIVCGGYTIYGMYVNMVRFIETHFLYSATLATIVSGMSSSAIGAVGSATGGLLVNKLKLDTKQTLKLIVGAGAVYVVGVGILVNIKCPQVQMDMTFTGDPLKSTVENPCVDSCQCTIDRLSYYPVCGSNGITYYSPCVAGCSSKQNNTFTDCKCLRKLPVGNQSLNYDYRTSGKPTQFETGTATPGYCTPRCKNFIYFTIFVVLLSFCMSITRVPGTMINFNIVDKGERSFALGINSFILNLFGFIPAPLLFGRLIDSSCILWQKNCSSLGACLLFNTSRLRYSIYGTTLCVETIELLCFIALFILIPKRPLHRMEEGSEDDAIKTEVAMAADPGDIGAK